MVPACYNSKITVDWYADVKNINDTRFHRIRVIGVISYSRPW